MGESEQTLNWHFDVLDFYRYVAAVGVVIFHFAAYMPLGQAEDAVAPLQLLVDFFFILSGFVIMHVYRTRMTSNSDYLVYLRKRLARIYPLHLLTLMVYIALAVCAAYGLFSFENPDRYPADAIVPNLLLVHAWGVTDDLTFNYPSWSISAEFFVYLLFPVLLLATRRLGEISCLTLVIAMAAFVAAFISFCGDSPWTRATAEFGCLRALPSFFAGMVIYLLVTQRLAHVSVPRWIGYSAALIPIGLMVVGAPDEIVLVAFAVVVLLTARMELSARPKLFSRPLLRNFSNASYGVYMLHPLVAAGMFRILPKIIEIEGAWMFGLGGIALGITTAVAMLSYRLFENPVRRILGGGIARHQLPRLLRPAS
ncbi:hypothetical protein AUC68_01590 [Methyloceanibacter methanicus]|uniref:Acyltransferase 3 domain-containing protein n=1 Tax=Methyloceanibacter methanicus TaxID=1774968 RepID=A0A1E3W224_9HYPH|nr:acyltransferase [Methyloceanibacter methanicus]ODR99854.1 hypothetical protein AUC68_01590 [Methyloceanibacter methanicus]